MNNESKQALHFKCLKLRAFEAQTEIQQKRSEESGGVCLSLFRGLGPFRLDGDLDNGPSSRDRTGSNVLVHAQVSHYCDDRLSETATSDPSRETTPACQGSHVRVVGETVFTVVLK